MPTVISVEHLSKSYKLGQIGTGTFAHDLNVWWAKLRGKPNPLLRIGEAPLRLPPNSQNLGGEKEGGEVEVLWALRDVSFTVEQGEVLGIIGRNGAGKSTLLKILSRVTAPTSGKIKVKGRIASLLEVGTGFHPELTGRENIYLNGAILGMKRREIDRKFDEIVDFAEVEKFIDTPVKRYSSGMYVRLAFAVAAHLDPEILVVDEVLAVGDVAFQKKCIGKMEDVASKGKTVLFVSHNLQVIANLCSESLLLKTGTLAEKDRTDKVISTYIMQTSNNVNDGEVDLLSNDVKHTGLGTSRFLKIALFGNDDIKKNTFQVGENFRIVFECDVMKLYPNQFYQVRIRSANGTPIYHWVDFDDGFPSVSTAGIDRVEIALDKITLYPGRYFVTFLVCDRYATAYDYVENAISFDIVEGDLVPLARPYYSSLGIIHEMPNWKRLGDNRNG